ncbi:MAG: shikimate kinase [Ilumatobacteraceae bacterium]|jgi:shikimate kinase|nr:shikimate kinase [Actinomycetes bacterium]
MSRIVVLVGMMGAGKTTVGRSVASRLGVDFVDTDDLVEARAGKSVRDIFASDGEAAFRTLESQVLAESLKSPVDVVVAAAGGTVLSESNRAALREHADVVVWLDADVSALGERASRGAHRPLLDGDVEDRLMALDGERRVLYQSVADVRLDTTGKGIAEVVQEVVAALAKEHAS